MVVHTVTRSGKHALMLAAAGIIATPAAAGPKPPFPLGVYVGNPNPGDPSAEAQFEADFASFTAALGAAPSYINAYVDYTQTVENWPGNASWQAWSNANSPVAKTLIPVIAVPMASINAAAAAPDAQFQAFAAGTYDSEIAGIVTAWQAQGFNTLYLRLGWEMNLQGPTYAGDSAQSQADWVAAFRHIAKIARATAAARNIKVRIVWNPGTTNYSNASATGSLYPGDGYVNDIGIDVYSDIYPYSDYSYPAYYDWDTGQEDSTVAQFIANPINRAHYWAYPAATKWSLDSSGGHSQSFLSLVAFAKAHSKRLVIPECGAGNSNAGTDVIDDPTFPQWLATQLKASGLAIGFVNIWNSNGGGNYEFSYAGDHKPQESAAWAQYLGVP
jgi:hypothetical protein